MGEEGGFLNHYRFRNPPDDYYKHLFGYPNWFLHLIFYKFQTGPRGPLVKISQLKNLLRYYKLYPKEREWLGILSSSNRRYQKSQMKKTAKYLFENLNEIKVKIKSFFCF